MRWINFLNKKCIVQYYLTHIRRFKLETASLRKDEHVDTEINSCQTQSNVEPKWNKYIEFCKEYDESAKEPLIRDMLVYEEFLSEEEENSLFQEVEPYMRKLRYEFAHWDDVSSFYEDSELDNCPRIFGGMILT